MRLLTDQIAGRNGRPLIVHRRIIACGATVCQWAEIAQFLSKAPNSPAAPNRSAETANGMQIQLLWVWKQSAANPAAFQELAAPGDGNCPTGPHSEWGGAEPLAGVGLALPVTGSSSRLQSKGGAAKATKVSPAPSRRGGPVVLTTRRGAPCDSARCCQC